MKSALVALTLTLVCCQLFAFRSYRDSGAKIVEEFDGSFQVSSQIEHYQTVHIAPDGQVEIGDMLLIYYYKDYAVYGLIHILSPDSLRGATLLSIQKEGEKPIIYRYLPGMEKAEKLTQSQWRERVGDSPWNYEDMLDDDKEDWDHVNRGVDTVDGTEAYVIFSTYNDPYLKRISAYSKRETYLARDDSRFLKTIFYDRSGDPAKTFNASMHRNIHGANEEPKIRAKRIHVTDHVSGAMNTMSVISAVYDIPLPMSFFNPDNLPEWNEKEAPQAIALAEGA